MRLKKSVSLDVQKKASVLRSVFNSSPYEVIVPRYRTRVSSPYMMMISQYVLPLFVLFFVGTQFGDSIVENAKIAVGEFNTVKSDIANAQKSAELKNSLSLNQKDITALKATAHIESADKSELIASVTTRSQDIQNKVASLVKENKITEAKQIVLTLETALKADELYKVATSVSDTIFSATDLRVDIENKEIEATTSVTDLIARIEVATKNLADMEVNASTTDLIGYATTHLTKAAEYIAADNTENAIISLQAHDRIVAEIRLILLP
jgi:hypothetical protein